MGRFEKIFVLGEEQMKQYTKFYDFAFELYNQNCQMSPISMYSVPTNTFPYYKHYFDSGM